MLSQRLLTEIYQTTHFPAWRIASPHDLMAKRDIFRIGLLSRAPFRNTNRVPVHRGITSKPRLVASIRRQHKQTPPCFQAAVDVNIRIVSLSALNKVTVSIIPKLRDAWQGSNWQLENPSIHRLGYRAVEDTITGSIAAAVRPATRRS